jgi:hypothetical protein
MNNRFDLTPEEKNRIRKLHLNESKDKRFTSVLNEQTPFKPQLPHMDNADALGLKPVYDTIPDPEILKRQMDLERGIIYDWDALAKKVIVSSEFKKLLQKNNMTISDWESSKWNPKNWMDLGEIKPPRISPEWWEESEWNPHNWVSEMEKTPWRDSKYNPANWFNWLNEQDTDRVGGVINPDGTYNTTGEGGFDYMDNAEALGLIPPFNPDWNPDTWYDDDGDPVLELDEEDCLEITFKCGGSNIVDDNDVYGIHWPDYMREGMAGDGKFIYITAGVSGPGNADDNQKVMNARIDAALDLLIGQTPDGPSGLPYSKEKIKSMADIEMVYGTNETGSVTKDGERVPTDPCDPWFEQFQFVKICFNQVGEKPNIGQLADEFEDATIGTSFNPLHPIDTVDGYDKPEVHRILNLLRHSGDFEEFSAELKTDYGMNFYEMACDTSTILGKDIAVEIGSGDSTINAILKGLGVDPISKYC